MGCKQTTAKSPSIIFGSSQISQISPTAQPAPIYVKSALKQPTTNGRIKSEKIAFSKPKPLTLNKSVNFDEKVEVKLRTPTPKQSRNENISAKKIRTKQINNVDDDDDDDNDDFDGNIQLSSNEKIKTSTISSNSSLQHNQTNGFWHKTNSVAVIPSANNIQERPRQPSVTVTTYPTERSRQPSVNVTTYPTERSRQPSVNVTSYPTEQPRQPSVNVSSYHTEQPRQPSVTVTTYPTENPYMPTGTIFRVRRKVPHSAVPLTVNPIDPNESVVLQSQRPLSNTNTVLIELREPYSSVGPSPQAAYYTFSRRPIDRTALTDK